MVTLFSMEPGDDELPNHHSGQLEDGRWWWHGITGGLCILGVGATPEEAHEVAQTRGKNVLQVIGAPEVRTWRTEAKRDALLLSMLDDWLADHPD